MDILLINSPIRLDAKPNCIPYGLATIAGSLRDGSYDVEIYDQQSVIIQLQGKEIQQIT